MFYLSIFYTICSLSFSPSVPFSLCPITIAFLQGLLQLGYPIRKLLGAGQPLSSLSVGVLRNPNCLFNFNFYLSVSSSGTMKTYIVVRMVISNNKYPPLTLVLI